MMDPQTFIAKIRDWSNRYKKWWFEPYSKFRQEYDKAHPSIWNEPNGIENYSNALKEFETKLREQQDLIGEFFDFLDNNYELYIETTSEQRQEIRTAFSNCYVVSNSGSVTHFMEDLLMEYLDERVRINLRETGDKNWLLRGLVAISLENCGIDYRDTLTQLVYLYIAAEEKGIDPESEFQAIAKLSSNEGPRGGSEPMSKMMAETHDSAYYRERTKSFTKK